MNNEIERVRVHLGDRSYDIMIGSGLFDDDSKALKEMLSKFTEGRRVLVIADSNTAVLQGQKVVSALEKISLSASLFVFNAGEASKTFATVENMARAAVKAGLDRTGIIVALGGGVTGDLAAFTSSIFMRGIRFIQIPTSLLAMIDSSVGGKTGADLPEGKNLIGTFHQPKAVVMDVSFLKTLPKRELACGFAELIKHAILFDSELFALLDDNAEKLMNMEDLPLLERLIGRSCFLKAKVVAEDEREAGSRALLNFGHSFGHAVEKVLNYRGMLHGEAVALGMAMASSLGVKLKMIKEIEKIKIEKLLEKYSLPVRYSGISPEDVLEAMAADKKNSVGNVRLIIPHKIGRCEIVKNPDSALVLDAIKDHIDA